MVVHKKRKLNSGTSPPLMSAFAARQQLRGARALAGAAGNAPDVDTESRASLPGDSGSTIRPPLDQERNLRLASLIAHDGAGLAEADSAPTTPILTPRRESLLLDCEPAFKRADGSLRPVSQHSTFRPAAKNCQRKRDGRLILSAVEGERLALLGSYGLRISEGVATVAGAVLTSSDTIHWLHTPLCHALPVIKMAADTVLELHNHPSAQGLRHLERLNPVFGKLWNHEASSGFPFLTKRVSSSDDTFRILVGPEDSSKKPVLHYLMSPAEWNKKLAELASPGQKSAPTYFICGPKSSGKSTFGKLLTNRLVTQLSTSKKRAWSSVQFLDLDPGQPEFSPPGVISLNKLRVPNLSPPFCHPMPSLGTDSQPRTHAIAFVSPAIDPQHFVESALDLFTKTRCSSNIDLPLVINTPGWIQGTGLDILVRLITTMHPTEVIYMSQDGPGETVRCLQAACGETSFSTLPSQTSEPAPRTAQHLRTIQMMSYFHANQASLRDAPPQWNNAFMTDVQPLRVRYRGPRRGFVGLLFYDHQPPPDLIPDAVNGMILALVKIEDNKAFRDLIVTDQLPATNNDARIDNSKTGVDAEDPSQRRGNTWEESLTALNSQGIPYIANPLGRTLDPKHSRALGLVLVRGIDIQRGELQILTPVPGKSLPEDSKSLVLVAGKFDTPGWAYTESFYNRSFGPSSEATLADMEDQEEETEMEKVADAQGESHPESKAFSFEDCSAEVPWVETLRGSQKRAVGSRAWRVRRDLGRS